MGKEIGFLLALVLILVILASAVKVLEVNVEQADARRFVLEDAEDRFPGADNEIIRIDEAYNEQNERYYHMKVRVTNFPATGCPERMHVYYNYPEQNFEPEPIEFVTTECRVCTQEPCALVFPEEAIIASHTLDGGEPVRAFLEDFPTAYPNVEQSGDTWRVTWDSPVSTYYYVVGVSIDGSRVSATRIDKEL